MKKWINNLKLRTKLYFILFLAAIVIFLSNLVLARDLTVTTEMLERELYDELYYSTYYLINADRDLYQIDQALLTLQVDDTLTGGERDVHLQAIKENFEQVKERTNNAQDILLNDERLNEEEVQQLFHDFFQHLSQWEKDVGQAITNDAISPAEWKKIRNEFDSTRDLIDTLQINLESVALTTIDEIHQDNFKAMITSGVTITLLVIILFILGYLLIRHIVNPVTTLVKTLYAVSKGNLQVEKMTLDRRDEIGKLMSSSNVMIESLQNIVAKIQNISQQVNERSVELSHASNAVSSGSQQVVETMEQISAGVQQQATSTTEISDWIDKLNDRIHMSNEEGKELDASSNRVYELSNDGKVEMEQSVQLMDEITSIMTETVREMEELEGLTQNVSKLIIVIRDVADQTNLLALNASIEAARAGEHGRGFAIVAEEVRKLAEQVGSSVSEITSIIEGIQEGAKSVVSTLQKGHEKVVEGNEQMNISHESFQSISEAIVNIRSRISNITTNLGNIAEISNKVNEAVEEIAASAEQSAAGVEESAATAEEQSTAMDEVATSAKVLSELSDELNDLINQFKL